MSIKFILIITILLFSCRQEGIITTRPSQEYLNDDYYLGVKIDKLILDYGLPNKIVTAESYSTKFIDVKPVVVFAYDSIRKRVYVDKESKIVAVFNTDDRGDILLDPE